MIQQKQNLSKRTPVEKANIGSVTWSWKETRPDNRTNALRNRIVLVLLLVSLLPLVLVGGGAWQVFHRLALDKTLELHRSLVQGHARAIDLHLRERVRALDLLAGTQSFASLIDENKLASVFKRLRDVYPNDFVDLGVIDDLGKHQAYIGPYKLKDKTYADAPWFLTVLERGSYISDVFLGHRKFPHCIIAIVKEEGQRRWILRATINNDSLYSLVKSTEVGATGDVFVVNASGLYQTPPRRGAVLDRAHIDIPIPHRGVVDQRVRIGGEYFSQVSTWINSGHWLLVVQQMESEIVAPIRRAMLYGALVIMAALLLLIVTTSLATGHLTKKIDKAKEQRDSMYNDLIRTSKLASLGEMSTGLAHEINNPLAIISVEQTNIGDLLSELNGPHATKDAIGTSVSRCKRQIERCSAITGKMLQFGRRGESDLRPHDIGPLVKDITNLMERHAHVNNIKLLADISSDVPKVLVNATEMEQVLINLINNSMQAIEKQGTISIILQNTGEGVELIVRDDGCGIPANDLDKVFQPFFTTKPVGKGTGLGLAVSYGLVRSWGGNIRIESEVNEGTQITVTFPPVVTLSNGEPSIRRINAHMINDDRK